VGRRRATSLWGRGWEWLVAAVVGAAVRGAGRLPPGLADRLGGGLGAACHALLRGRRRIALANLELALGPELDPARRAAVARAHFRHLGVTALEDCRLFFGAATPLLESVRVEGLEYLRAALGHGHGVLCLTAHLGNWELLAAAHSRTGVALNVVVRPLDNPHLEALLARGRARGGVGLIPKRRALRPVMAALARGECVGMLLDQDAGQDGVFVPYFGHPASTSRSLAVLALKTGAPVVPAFIQRLADGGHRVTLEPMVPLASSGDRSQDVAAATAAFTAVIERHVRAQPEQWFWVHRRWKTRPS
jgi:KDO2-lipid IV(A) lauroyltransferase